MTLRVLRWACVVVTAGGLVATVAAFAPRAGADIGDVSGLPAAAASQRLAPVHRDSLVRVAAARDPFRLTRSAAPAAFNPRIGGVPIAPPSSSARPQLVLAGILLGAEPAVLIDGLPGAAGTRVLRTGERLGDYMVRSIGSDRVIIAGPDTTWTLVLRSRFP